MGRLIGFAALRAAFVGAVVIVVLAGASRRGEAIATAAPAVGNRAFGLAHVDVMEFHAARVRDGPAQNLERLSPDELAERFRRATESGAAWHRWSLYWDLAYRDGRFDFAASDGIVERDLAAGSEPLVILQGIPAAYALEGAGGVQATNPQDVLGPDGGWRSTGAVRDLFRPAFIDDSGAPTDDPAAGRAANPANPWSASWMRRSSATDPGAPSLANEAYHAAAASTPGRSGTSPICVNSGAAVPGTTPGYWRWHTSRSIDGTRRRSWSMAASPTT